MNIFDFDDTVYRGDSGVDFILFSLKRKPFLVLGSAFKSLKYVFLYKFKNGSFEELKASIFSYVTKIDDLDQFINEYVEKNAHKLKEWYKQMRKKDDVIISASMDFYLVPLCKNLKLNNVMCTKFDIKTGKIIGKNCKGQEKVIRFRKKYDLVVPENSYSDSKSDIPMLEIAKKAFYVKDEELIPYVKEEK